MFQWQDHSTSLGGSVGGGRAARWGVPTLRGPGERRRGDRDRAAAARAVRPGVPRPPYAVELLDGVSESDWTSLTRSPKLPVSPRALCAMIWKSSARVTFSHGMLANRNKHGAGKHCVSQTALRLLLLLCVVTVDLYRI